jgi:hypothetical protein
MRNQVVWKESRILQLNFMRKLNVKISQSEMSDHFTTANLLTLRLLAFVTSPF